MGSDAVYPEGPYGTPILPAERPETDEERGARIREQNEILYPITYTITAKRLQMLLYAETMLDELSAAGVDNWGGLQRGRLGRHPRSGRASERAASRHRAGERRVHAELRPARSRGRVMRPEDPCFDGQGLAFGPGGYDESSEELIQHGHEGRAAFQRRAASYLGVAFGDVAALRRYARILTRQEMWDSHGRDYARDVRVMELGMGWYFSRSSDLRPGATDGWYYDGIDPVDGYIRPALPGHVAELEAIDSTATVPTDWSVPVGAEWPSWEFTDRFDPDGFPVLIAEEH
jgi:hypothetical protein